MNSRFSHYLKHIDIWSLSRMHLFIEVSEVLLIMTVLGCCIASSDFMELQFRVLSVLRQPCHSYTSDMTLKLWTEICCDVLIFNELPEKAEWWVAADLAVHHYNLRLDRVLLWRLCCWEGQKPKSVSNTGTELLCALSTKNLCRIIPAIARGWILLCLKFGFISQLCKGCFSSWFCSVLGEHFYFWNL